MSEVLATSASLCTSSSVFHDVMRPECNLAVWERQSPAALENLVTDNVQDARFQTKRADLRQRLTQELEKSGFANGLERDELIADVEMLADHYCSILGLGELDLRLEVVTTNSCRKWHADYVKARLITTYTGSGTQWLDQSDADRVRQGEDPLRINSMSAGDVGIFKGKLATDTPVIHRSPPIEGTGEKRLLLVLNPPESM
ncbi:MAG: DUF1826 domain-containing protein [Pseudomonadota bacterium]